ncbi:unnamed protein product [Laminaria digitata]
MVRPSALSATFVALAATSCTAFVSPRALPRVAHSSTTSMSMKGGNSSPISKAAGIVGKVLFSRPGGIKMGNNSNGNGGMMGGGGNSNGRGGAFDSSDEGESMDKLAMLGVLASVKGGASGLWDSYNGHLAEKPILVKACTSLVGFSIGDFLAQKGTSKDKFSYERLARMAAFGFLFHGTISHFFYNALDAALPGTAAFTVIQKASTAVVIDQVFWAPIFTLIFFTWIGITSGASPSEIATKIKSDLIQGVVGSWTVWPLAHTINFKFVPTDKARWSTTSTRISSTVFPPSLGSN